MELTNILLSLRITNVIHRIHISNTIMAKTPTSFRLSEKAKALLSKLAERENRSETNMIEVLILEKAKALNISVD